MADDLDDNALYTDGDGLPTLFDVVLPGDMLRRYRYVLRADGAAPGEEAPACAAGEGDADAPASRIPADSREDARAFLERRIRMAIERTLAESMVREVRAIPEHLLEETGRRP